MFKSPSIVYGGYPFIIFSARKIIIHSTMTADGADVIPEQGDAPGPPDTIVISALIHLLITPVTMQSLMR